MNNDINKGLMISQIVFPIFASFLLVTVPNWSQTLLYFVLPFLIFDIIFGLIILLGLKQQRTFIVLQFDLFTFFLLGMVHRMWDGNIVLGLFLFFCFIASIYIGHKKFDEVSTFLSSSIALITLSIVGIFSIFLGRFQEYIPNGLELSMGGLILICSYILLQIHAAWAKSTKN